MLMQTSNAAPDNSELEQNIYFYCIELKYILSCSKKGKDKMPENVEVQVALLKV